VIGLKLADLFSEPAQARADRPKSIIVASYDYADVHGRLLARKVRFLPKAFRWQVPDSRKSGAFKWGLEGVEVGLYNLPALIDGRQVFITEGERAVERLAALGFAATCPPHGASGWRDQWSEDLWRLRCVEAVVLIDADTAGRQHARRVAQSCWQLERSVISQVLRPGVRSEMAHGAPPDSARDRVLQVKLVALPGIPENGDIVDYLDRGASADDLRALVAATPPGHPMPNCDCAPNGNA
jgi:hypothetical protein